jgi:hypothetical protein
MQRALATRRDRQTAVRSGRAQLIGTSFFAVSEFEQAQSNAPAHATVTTTIGRLAAVRDTSGS